MTGFRSDNTSGSAWVSSNRGFSLPHRQQSLESAFLAGDYNKRRRNSLTGTQRQEAKNRPLSQARHNPQPGTEGAGAPPSYHIPQPPVGHLDDSFQQAIQDRPGTRSVGRLRNVTAPADQRFFPKVGRQLDNIANKRLQNHESTFEGSSGFALDGVELTKEEYDAWLAGDPEANRFVHVEGTPAPLAPNPAAPSAPASSGTAPKEDGGRIGFGKIAGFLIAIFVVLPIVGGLLGEFFDMLDNIL